jgi:hypothetical protein
VEDVWKIYDYLLYKYNSGLLLYFGVSTRIHGLEFHLSALWGTYQELVYPELTRLCSECRHRLSPLSQSALGGGIPLEKDAPDSLDDIINISFVVRDMPRGYF